MSQIRVGKRADWTLWIWDLLAISTFFTASHFLHQWYLYESLRDFLKFCAFALIGFGCLFFGSAGFSIRRVLLQKRSRFRLICCVSLAILFLPWGEFFHGVGAVGQGRFLQQIFWNAIWASFLLGLFYHLPWLREFFVARAKQFLRFAGLQNPLIAACIFFLASLFLAIFYFRMTPIVHESALDLFQAKIFLNLHRSAPLPASPEFFQTDGLVQNFKGWEIDGLRGLPAILSLSLPFHLEWFVGPLLAAATVLLWMIYIYRWYDPNASALFAVLFLLSPLLIITSSTIMSIVAEALIAVAALFLCRRCLENHSVVSIALLFLVCVSIFPTGGIPLLIFNTPVLIHTAFQSSKGKSLPRSIRMTTIVGGLVLGSFLSNISISPAPFANSIEIVSNHLLSLNDWITGWHIGFFIVLIPTILMLAFDTWDRLLAAGGVGTIIYSAFFKSPDSFAPHEFYLLVPVLFLWISRFAQRNHTVLALMLVSILAVLPERLPGFLMRASQLRSEAAILMHEQRNLGKTPALIFLSSNVSEDYLVWNDPYLNSNIIYARDLGEKKNATLIRDYSNYRVFYFQHGSETPFGKEERRVGLYSDQKTERQSFSFFAFALLLEDESDDTKDIFDRCYFRFLNKRSAPGQLKYVIDQQRASINESGYKESYRKALIGTAVMMLTARYIYGQDPSMTSVDTNQFMDIFRTAKSNFQNSGEVGKSIVMQFIKVEERMDKNDDGVILGKEVRQFLIRKLEGST